MKQLKFAPNLRDIILTGEKYATFKSYYDVEVGPDTLVKIYKFSLIQ